MAEVLIAIAIIGIIAAMTIPNLIANYKEKQAISSYKKIYRELSVVNQQLNAEYGGSWTGECSDFDNVCFMNLFASKMKVRKNCDNPLNGCQSSSIYLSKTTRELDININDNTFPAFITNSGYSVKFRFHIKGCLPSGGGYSNLPCGWVQIDTNGLRKPNIAGKDIFFINFFSDGTIKGAVFGGTLSNGQYVPTSTNLNALENDCKNGTGISCSALYLIK